MGVTAPLPDVQKLCNTLIVNDFKGEYYFSQNQIVRDAIQAHRVVAERYPQAYRKILELMNPVMLDCQKTMGAIFLWDRGIDKAYAKKLIMDVRPAWKMTFFNVLQKPPEGMGLHTGWGRTIKAMIRDMFNNTTPYMLMKYADKMRPLAARAHIKENDTTSFLFHKSDRAYREKLIRIPEYNDYFKLQNWTRGNTWSDRDIADYLPSLKVPYTIATGLLGGKSADPKYATSLLSLMTPWETLLALVKLENAGIDFAKSEVKGIIAQKLNPEKLKTMKIDPVELFQAYNKVHSTWLKFILQDLINRQLKAISNELLTYLGGKKVAVAFDCSGSMKKCAEWSMMLGYALSTAMPNTLCFGWSERGAVVRNFWDQSNVDTTRSKFIAIKPDYGAGVLRGMEGLMSHDELWGGTPMGQAIQTCLENNADIIFLISDMQQNVPPTAIDVYNAWTQRIGRFPELFAFKFTADTAWNHPEPMAYGNDAWTGIPTETSLVIRNIWDLPKILNYHTTIRPDLMRHNWYI